MDNISKVAPILTKSDLLVKSLIESSQKNCNISIKKLMKSLMESLSKMGLKRYKKVQFIP